MPHADLNIDPNKLALHQTRGDDGVLVGESVTVILKPKIFGTRGEALKSSGRRVGNNQPGERCGFAPDIAKMLVTKHGAKYAYTLDEIDALRAADAKVRKREESRLDRLERESHERDKKLDQLLALFAPALEDDPS